MGGGVKAGPRDAGRGNQRATKSHAVKLPRLRKWTKETLTQRDWDFTTFCDALEFATSQLPEIESLALVYRAFTWEIERELGSGNGPFDLEKELARPSMRQSSQRECEVVLQRDSGPTIAVAIEPPLWLLKQPRMNPSKPQDVCIRGVSAFVEKLRQQALPAARFLMSKFSEPIRQQVLEIRPRVMGSSGGSDELIRLHGPLQNEINRIIRSGSIYAKDRFKGVSLSAETRSVLKSTPSGEELIRLNRLLLEDAFPDDIPKGPRQLRPLNEWHLGELRDYLGPDTISASRASNDICALEIPWTEDEDKVVEAFRLWLQEHRGRHVGEEGAGRKREWRWQFTNLAVYRLAAAGYERTKLLKKVGSMSASSYNRAMPFIAQEIRTRFGNMQSSAKSLAEQSPDLADWRRHFLKQ